VQGVECGWWRVWGSYLESGGYRCHVERRRRPALAPAYVRRGESGDECGETWGGGKAEAAAATAAAAAERIYAEAVAMGR
jgi:hypothetical protein